MDKQAALAILDECARVPEDIEAQCVARWMHELLSPKPPDPITMQMRNLLSDYALGIVDGDSAAVAKATAAIRRLITAR